MPSTAPAKHYRAHARRAVRLRALVTQPEAAWQSDATVRDLCLGGASVAMREGAKAGDRVTISFFAASLWDPLALPARVVWVRPQQAGAVVAGLAFEPPDSSSLFALFELLSTVST